MIITMIIVKLAIFQNYSEKYKDNRSLVPIFSDCSNLQKIKKFKPNNPMSKNSTFDFLAKNGGKIVTFGANFAPSFIMYVENCIPGGPRYRYMKKFNGIIKIKKNQKIYFYPVLL